MLQIRLLGQFDVRLDGKRVLIPSRAGQSLLAYLVLTAGTAHRREKLAGLFWSDLSDENARKNLRHDLWRIRKAISAQNSDPGDYLLVEEFTIAFNRNADYWLDVAQVERPDLDPESLISNLSLYMGELLPGFYEDWIVLERERIQSIFDAKMEQLLAQLVAAQRWTAAQEQAERWLGLGNTLEPAYRALMLAYGARGDMARVSSIYQRCMNELDEKFGLEPSPETRALYDGLLRGTHLPARAVQPSSTVTFLFTDIEESTNLLDTLGEQYATVLAEHHQILRSAIQKWNGREVETQGDAFFVTFSRALDAVQCAVDAQRALASHPWPHQQPLWVRMGLHTGEPLIASTGYVGMDVHRAARIGDASHGGQVLLSQTTRELVMHDLPKGVKLRDLGEVRLKDLRFPTPIYQLVIEGLRNEFPPLRTKFAGTEAPTPGDPPFKGLQYFEEADSELFFGRELLTAKLVDRLRGLPSPSGEGAGVRFLSVIIGASGSGKSSLVRAGLIPALKKGEALVDGLKPPEGSSGWQVHIITPTAHPLQALATELTGALESVTAAATLIDDLMQDPRSLALYLARQRPKHHTLLVLDQFEELFTLCRDEFEREAFIDNLLTTVNQSEGHITLILTLRADFYAHLAQYPELRDIVSKQQEYIGPMTTDELRRAIEEPAKRGHWTFEPGLVDLILRDVGEEPGALPLLSHALLETWKRRAGHTLTLKGYADAGGVRGAIAHTAENVYQNFSTDEHVIARDIFLRLTELGEGTEDTRRRASLEELMSSSEDASLIRAVLNKLAEARLVTLSENTAEVAHEALIREWPTLREWLNQDREGLRLHRRLTEAAQEWELLERDPGGLYRGAPLAQAREWAALHPKALNAAERVFLNACNQLEQQDAFEREAQRQRELESAQKLAETEKRAVNQLRRRALLLAAAFALAMILAGFALFFQHRAKQNAITATSRELAAASISNLEIDPERSILLALQAVDTAYTIEAEDALHRAVQTSRVQLVVPAHEPGAPMLISFSPDGKRVVTSSRDELIKVWDAVTGEHLLTMEGHYAVYSPDGKRIASVVSNGTVKMWDATTGEEIPLPNQVDAMIGVAFSPDGSRIATITSGLLPKVWDAKTGKELVAFPGHTDFVSFAFFSPNGARLLTLSDDGTARVWDAYTGEELLNLSRHPGRAENSSFSPDGKRIATVGGENGTDVYIWDAETGEKLLTLVGHTGFVIGVSFSPDGTRIATASADGKAIVWDAVTGAALFTLAGHSGIVVEAKFSPGGTHLATSSEDGTWRLWDVTPSRELFTFSARTDSSGQLAFSTDGKLLATTEENGAVKIRNAQSGKEVQSVPSSGKIYDLAFSPDGKQIVIANEDRTVGIWDVSTGKKLETLSGHTGFVNGIVFNKDGTRLVTAGEDFKINIWDTSTLLSAGTSKTPVKLLRTIEHPAEVRAAAFDPDGKRLVTGSFNGTVLGWDPDTGKPTPLELLRVHRSSVNGVAFSPDGKRLATASEDGTAKIWDATSAEELFTLRGHIGGLQSIAYSPDGKRIATASLDGTAKLWDAETGQELLTFFGDGSGLFDVAFSPDGTRLATGSSKGIRVYLLQIDELRSLAQTRVTRGLTSDECQKYLHKSPSECAPAIAVPTTTALPPTDQGRVCQVTDTSGLNDDSFNELIYKGLQDSHEIYGWDIQALQSASTSDIDKNFAEFQRGDCDLIIGIGTFPDALRAAALADPKQKFLLPDVSFDEPMENVWTQIYATNQAAFLAGYAAASVTRTGKVGVFGGVDFLPVTDFMDGFVLGVQYYNDKHGTNIEVLGWNAKKREGLFVGGFCCAAEGRAITGQLLDAGADIILPVAGPDVGAGALFAVKSHGDAYIIGVDNDWAVSNPTYADIILTSVMKNLDASVVQTVKAIEEGTFTGGVHVGTLETGEVGLAPFHELDSLVSDEVKADLEQIKKDIIAGKVKTKP